MDSAKIVVFGGSGFIGSNICREFLSSGNEIHALVRTNSNIWRLEDIKDSLQIHSYTDISDQAVVDILREIRPEIVVNAIGTVGKHIENSLQEWESNFLSLIHLVNAIVPSKVDRLIHLGSSFEYGKASLKYPKLSEDVECMPVSEYGLAKLFQTNYCTYLNRSGAIPVTVLRIFNVFGEYEAKERLIPEVILKALDGKTIELQNPRVERDFILIKDVLSAIIRIIADYRDTDFNGILNIGTGIATRVEEVARIIVGETGGMSNVLIHGEDMRPENYIPGPIADISKMERIAGWKPRPDINNALKETVRWFKENRVRYKSIYG